MSLDIDWEKLDDNVAKYMRKILEEKLQTTKSKPNFIGDITVDTFDFGTNPPDIQLLNVTDPFPEFYYEEQVSQEPTLHTIPSHPITSSVSDEVISKSTTTVVTSSISMTTSTSTSTTFVDTNVGSEPISERSERSHLEPIYPNYFTHQSEYLTADVKSLLGNHNQENRSRNDLNKEIWNDSPPIPTKSPSDFQIEAMINARGSDMCITILTELFIDIPSPRFLCLPVKITITGFHLVATIIIAKFSDRINWCFLDPDFNKIEPVNIASTSSSVGGGASGSSGVRGRQYFIQQPKTILRELHIESEVGDRNMQVLKNVSKVEKFIADQLRSIIDDQLVFPSYQSVILD